METIFRTTFGRLALILGGADLGLMGVASLVQDPDLTANLVALVPMLSIAVGINIIGLSTVERGGELPIALLSILLLLGGVYVYGLEHATAAGPAVGIVLVSIGAIAAILGAIPARRSVASTKPAAGLT